MKSIFETLAVLGSGAVLLAACGASQTPVNAAEVPAATRASPPRPPPRPRRRPPPPPRPRPPRLPQQRCRLPPRAPSRAPPRRERGGEGRALEGRQEDGRQEGGRESIWEKAPAANEPGALADLGALASSSSSPYRCVRLLLLAIAPNSAEIAPARASRRLDARRSGSRFRRGAWGARASRVAGARASRVAVGASLGGVNFGGFRAADLGVGLGLRWDFLDDLMVRVAGAAPELAFWRWLRRITCGAAASCRLRWSGSRSTIRF